ncbi:MAG: hypothetical protein JRF29_06335 [Deltaproteobacteria bacterium]|nr:hypothetical protein [Deltaproteobacteria bacterium]
MKMNRKTIRKYGQLDNLVPPKADDHSNAPTGQGVATGSGVQSGKNPPPRRPAPGENL